MQGRPLQLMTTHDPVVSLRMMTFVIERLDETTRSNHDGLVVRRSLHLKGTDLPEQKSLLLHSLGEVLLDGAHYSFRTYNEADFGFGVAALPMTSMRFGFLRMCIVAAASSRMRT